MPCKFLQFVLSINSSIVFCLANSPPMHASYFNFRAFSSIKRRLGLSTDILWIFFLFFVIYAIPFTTNFSCTIAMQMAGL